ncbi:FAD-dependent oxidoreductase [Helicovermis profundi]|uniref:FAD-dependent oxidoreductase n=1 Tax=Helicovermis profundi TaxID=3065157 RepID=A0AAU9EDB5_9FIRM|nr:FAD-dependent oxidoreductase [Clostridia bacterium S502]
MDTLNLKNGITWVGALDPNLKVFDIIMETEFGTSYNSYIVEGKDKIALFETVKIKFFDEYIKKLKSLIDINKIEYIVVDHTEPDHVGSVEKLLKLNPNMKIVGSTTALRFLKNIVNMEFESIAVSTGDTIDLGGKTLEFISAPFLHWPDSMYTYVKEDKALITCDSFGAHYSFDEILLSKVKSRDDYMSALKYYHTMIFGPFKAYLLSAIKKIEKKEIDMILPGHGPVLDENPWEIVDIYRKWSTEEPIFTNKTVVVPYVSAYGYTKTIAEKIVEGIKSEKLIDVFLYDMVYEDKNKVLEKIRWSDGILFGTPTINGDALPPIWDLVMSMSPIIHSKKLTAVFGSYGWSGEGVSNIEDRLKQVRTNKFADGLKINFKPSISQEELAFNYGKEFAKTLLGTIEKPLFTKTSRSDRPKFESDGKIKKWRCVVCGDIFEGEYPPEICPTCGASSEQFEEYIEEENLFVSEEELNIVIIGNGIAGLSAAKAARKRNKVALITIISSEKTITYNRPMLSDYMVDDYDEKSFYIENEDWYKENNILLKLNTRIDKINDKDQTLTTSGLEVISYDKLIIANGSRCFVPPITDINLDGVFTVRTIDDVDKIIKYSENVNNVVILGGGLLGLESAFSMLKLGKKVTIVELSRSLASRQLDKKISSFLKNRLGELGVKVFTNMSTNAILGNEKVSGVHLCDSQVIDAELVIVSAGIRSNISIGNDTALDINRGIKVNEFMESNIKNIYAAGDVAEYDSLVYGIWPASQTQGEIAGANSVGDNKKFEHFTLSTVFSGFDLEFFSIGDIGNSDDEKYSYILIDDLKNGNYQKFTFDKNILVGGILFGDMKNSIKLINGIKNGLKKDNLTMEFFS